MENFEQKKEKKKHLWVSITTVSWILIAQSVAIFNSFPIRQDFFVCLSTGGIRCGALNNCSKSELAQSSPAGKIAD